MTKNEELKKAYRDFEANKVQWLFDYVLAKLTGRVSCGKPFTYLVQKELPVCVNEDDMILVAEMLRSEGLNVIFGNDCCIHVEVNLND